MKTIILFLLFQTVGFDLALVAPLAAFIALPVKGTVDTLKGAFPFLPSKALPIVGTVVGFCYSLIVLVGVKHGFAGWVFAQCFLAAIAAQLGSSASTGLQNWANDKREDAGIATSARSSRSLL